MPGLQPYIRKSLSQEENREVEERVVPTGSSGPKLLPMAPAAPRFWFGVSETFLSTTTAAPPPLGQLYFFLPQCLPPLQCPAGAH